MTEQDLQAWLSSPTEEPVEYFRGFLATVPFILRPVVTWQVLHLALKGRLVIAQRRHGVGDYSYLAWKRRAA